MGSTEDFDLHIADLSKELGRGGFGCVYEGKDKKTAAKVAIKMITVKSDKVGALAVEEIKIHASLEHENIVKYFNFYYRNKSFWIIMEFCEEGDLNQYTVKTKPNMNERFKIMYQCACAVTYLHEQKRPIAHRDLKPGNILINCQSVVKLTDYGLSKMVDMDEMAKTALFNSVGGTLNYMAPEQFGRRQYGFPVDVFAMGLVYLALMTYTRGDILIPKGKK